jgi:hypothetical protein
MLSDWVSFLTYPNLFGIKGFVVVVVISGNTSKIADKPDYIFVFNVIRVY